MRSVVHDRYGPPEVLRVADAPRPVPKDDEVLVGVIASTVTRGDAMGVRGVEYRFTRVFTGIRRPRQTIFGSEFAGRVEEAGAAVTEFSVADVTAVCDTKDIELVRSLGAQHVVDRLNDEFTKGGTTYDVIFDAVGKHSFRRCRNSLKTGGTFITVDLGFMYHVPFLALLTRFVGSKRARLGIGRYRKEDLTLIAELIAAGKYRPVVDRTYPLDEIVEATRYVESGQKTGNVVLRVTAPSP
jgi:NADPH:quinone reductase-like Zn-dependent oxidoreductase